ncbi:MAG TPA: DUF2760 domain-containing protein [Terriglobales bacterium]|nr:DUF2760 domain-containing protein [Terriglobales bacterium]
MPGFWKRVGFAFRSFSSILFHGEVPEDVAREVLKPELPSGATAEIAVTTVIEEPEAEPSDGAVQMLALLQRDGRLIDFLSEDVAPYPDVQLGAAVRTVHQSCREVLERYFKLEPIFSSEEDQLITLQPGFDPAMVKLIGNVSSGPPMTGVLRHRGWQVKEANLPSLPRGSGRKVVAPAEVEVP